jgi:hypothetical protein
MSTEPSGLRTSPSFAEPSAPVDDPAPPPPASELTTSAPAPSAPATSSPEPEQPSPPTRTLPSATDDRPARPAPSRGKPPPRRKRKARRVHRVVHHLDVWSVAKVSAAFVACAYVTGMISGFLLWQAADRVGTIDGIEGFIESSAAYDRFEILGDVVFRVAAGVGLALALVALAMAVLGALLFNLISDLTGGIRMTVIDEDLIVAPARRPAGAPASGPPTRARG